MAIYSTDTYEILSIMNNFLTNADNVTTFHSAMLYVQALPEVTYPYTQAVRIHRKYGLVQEDFDVYDRFVANAIPIFETAYLSFITSVTTEGHIESSANSAISPISMMSSSTTV
jgi:hypothetical protein